MKSCYKFLLMFVFILMSTTTIFATENSYKLVKELTYKNTTKKQLPRNATIEVMIGTKDTVQYQKDGDIVINPAPDELKRDEYGNVYAYYNMEGFGPGNEFNIKIERTFDLETFDREISVRTNSEVNDDNEIYLEPQLRIESDEPEIIAKAKELTYELSSDYKKARAIFEFVNTELYYTTSEQYANKGAAAALKNKKGVCEEFATLYVALCRAIDIPARAVEGYMFELVKETDEDDNEIEYYKLTNHLWSEIYLEEHGWVPVETCFSYEEDGKRVPYDDAFCKIESIEYIATGLYNYEKANRAYTGYLDEIEFSETLTKISNDETEERHEFSDITENYAWSKDAIDNLYMFEIVKGYTDEEFGPEKNISRIEFMTMLSRTLKQMGYYAEEGGLVYYHMDYDQNHWSKKEYDYLMRCYQAIEPSDTVSMGYYTLAGVFGSSLQMDKPITREEVVALMDCFLKSKGVGTSFSDIENSSFKESIIKANENGLINVYPDGTFTLVDNVVPDIFIIALF